MSMSKKHYNAIAESFNELLQDNRIDTYSHMDVFNELVYKLTRIMKADNSNFDRDRFYSAIYKDKVKP